MLYLTLLFLLSLSACVSEGACEKIQAFTGTSDAIYSCTEDEAERCADGYSDVNIWGEPFTISYSHHPGTSCAELGYIHECPQGAMTDAECLGRTRGGSGTSGGAGGDGGACGTSSYGGPYYDDYQVESLCEGLWASNCSAEAEASYCEALDQWAANGTPNVCPYC